MNCITLVFTITAIFTSTILIGFLFFYRYQFSEIIDSQLKQMSDDLKEIIEHINESNKDEEITNPVSTFLIYKT